MRRLILLTALVCAIAMAQVPQRSSAAWTVTTTGTAASKTSGAHEHTLAVVPSGSPTSCTIKLEGSLDGSAWFDLSGAQTCTSDVMFHVTSKPVNVVRVNVTALSGGTSPSLDVKYLGRQ
jgi:hypothetical protein